jgi:hypothetical protein
MPDSVGDLQYFLNSNQSASRNSGYHAVRHVRAAACRTTNKFGSPNQQQEIKKYY